MGHALPNIAAYAASFLQIGIIWANHYALFRLVERVDQLLLLANLLLLGCVSFLPLPTRLVAEHTTGADAGTAILLYGGTLTGAAVAFNHIWYYSQRRVCSSTGSARSSNVTWISAISPAWSATSQPPCSRSSRLGSPCC